jgi:hypothetical protein
MPMNFASVGRSMLKSVNDRTIEAIIGPAVNRTSPISHGPMNT